MARVLLKGLTKDYDGVVGLKGLDLEVKDREFVVLLGPSGCGKTTTLRCIAGLEEPSAGEIRIGNRLVNGLDPKERNVAMVFQSYALYPHMTVYQNMAFPLENARLPTRDIVKRVNETAKLLQMQGLLGRKPSQLSGGQRQRAALGRALVREPDVFLMDEPLSNLDAKLRVHMRAELKRLQDDIGITTVYVTHDQIEAMTMADRIALLDRGILQQFDTPRVVYDRPANEFVAGFVGNPPINLIPCDLTDGALDAGDFRVPRPAAIAGHAGETALTLGVRPQDVRIVEDAGRSGTIAGEVYTVEPLGDTTIVNVQVGAHLIRAVAGPQFDPERRGTVQLEFPEGKVHLFERTTGKALC